MIDIAKLRKINIGKWVVYDNGFTKEKGRIKSWNDKFIFVVYKCDNNWDKFENYTGCATDPKDLQSLKYIREVKEGKMIFEIEKTTVETIML